MRSYPNPAVLAIAVFAVTAVLGAGCSSTDNAEHGTAQTSTATSEPPPQPAGPVEPDEIGVSPGGVTTRVDVPADATESQYGQACLAAKHWMDNQGGDPQPLVEPYLKLLQEPGFSDPGNFNTPWVDLTPAQQAGVIMAANAAANGECG